jgi:Uma2 family endonuclease
MSSTSTPVTAAQLAALPDRGKRYELVDGVLRTMTPAGNLHGKVAARLTARLLGHVEARELGVVYAAETGFLIRRDPDTVLAPDVAFVRQGRLDALGETAGYLPLTPDLVGEVVSPSDSYSEVEDKALRWLAAGCRMVLVVDPGTRTVQVYRAADRIVVLDLQGRLEGEDVVPGWVLSVAELFA